VDNLKTNITNYGQIGILNKFIDSDELKNIEKMINSFNPFKVLKIDKYEIRHSNIIAWLINPSESHGLGDVVLKEIASSVIDQNNINIDIKKTDIKDAEVFRERYNIDILAVSKSNKLAIIIENKVYSRERKDQLNRYLDTVKNKYVEYDTLPIFLTLFGDRPTDCQEYYTLSYEEVYDVLKGVISANRHSIDPKVIDFIDYYMKILEVLLMKNEDMERLCKEIYSNHKDAIDLIVQHGIVTQFGKAVEEFIDKNRDLEKIYSNNRIFIFIPKTFKKTVPDTNVDTRDKYLVIFWFKRTENKIHLYIEVGEFENKDKRIEFMQFLKSKSKHLKFTEYAFNLDTKTTKVFSVSEYIDDWDDKEEILNKMYELYDHKFVEAKNEIINLVKEFNWSRAL